MRESVRRVMVIVAASSVTGPVKGIFQLLGQGRERGVEYYLYNFRARGHDSSAFVDEARRAAVDVRFLDQGRRAYIRMLRQARGEVGQKRISIVQTHGFKPSFVGLYLKVATGMPWVCFMHGTTTENLKVRLYHCLDSLMQWFADRTVLMSEAQRPKILGGQDRERVVVIHNAVDASLPTQFSLDRRAALEKASIPADARLVVVVGRLSPEKGVDVFLNAFRYVARDVADAHAIIVGDGQERRRLEAQAVSQGLGGRVHFVGYTDTPGDYLAAATVVVLPSRSEGIPNVALEAMALERPVVATAVGGTPEVIEHGKSGLLVPPEQAAALASAVIEVLGDAALSAKLAQAGLARVRAHFSPRRRADLVFDLYDQVSPRPSVGWRGA